MHKIIAVYKDKEHIKIENSENISMINTDDMITPDFLMEVNSLSDSIVYTSDYINELFMYYGMQGLMYEKSFLDNDVTNISVTDIDIYDKVFLSKAIKHNLKVPFRILLQYKLKSIVKLLISMFTVFILSFLIPLYIFIKIKSKNSFNKNNFCIVRSLATDKKISLLQENFNISFLSDNLTYKESNYVSMYSVPIVHQFKAIFIVPFITIRDLFALKKESEQMFDFFFLGHFLYQYIFRIPFKSTFEYYFTLIIKYSKGKYFTGNKEDRYAICEKRVSKKYFRNTVCIPHGLEYSFKEPAGVVGDLFYCTSVQSQKTLSRLYIDNRFVFDRDVVKKMFSVLPNDTVINRKKIVFFTEAKSNQDIEINKKIIQYLVENNIEISLKLHPKDRITNYSEFNNLKVIHEFVDSITNSICLARKSTVLMEAIYNNSISIAVLIDSSDKNKYENWFPSLNMEEIIKIYKLEDLVSKLKILIKEK
jgi:hypothetical protein